MKTMSLILSVTFLTAFAGATFAQIPDVESDPKERQKAHRQVEKDKKILNKKLKEKAPPQEIHEAKAKLQTDRVEKNREDYKHGIVEGEEGGQATH